jgi:hypothetical protein
MSYHVGDLITVSAAWTDGNDVATDPTAVYCQYNDPSDNTTTLQYLVDAALERDSAGNYHVDIDADEEGIWRYRFYSTGSGQAASTVKSILVLPVTL